MRGWIGWNKNSVTGCHCIFRRISPHINSGSRPLRRICFAVSADTPRIAASVMSISETSDLPGFTFHGIASEREKMIRLKPANFLTENTERRGRGSFIQQKAQSENECKSVSTGSAGLLWKMTVLHGRSSVSGTASLRLGSIFDRPSVETSRFIVKSSFR